MNLAGLALTRLRHHPEHSLIQPVEKLGLRDRVDVVLEEAGVRIVRHQQS